MRHGPKSVCQPTVVLAGLLSIVLTGCSLEAPLKENDPAITIKSRRVELSATEHLLRGSIPFTFENRSHQPVYIVNCNRAYSLLLEKQHGDEWVEAWSPILPLCLSAPMIVRPWESFADTVRVIAGTPKSNTGPQFKVDSIAGSYRLRLTSVLKSFDADAYPFGAPVRESELVSGTFNLGTKSP